MRNESVAILDVRSYEVTFYLGAKGVNDIFVVYDSHTEKYDGFWTDGFFDEENFRRAVVASITSVRQNYGGVIGEIYVGVPSAFTSVMTKGHTLSFPSKRKLTQQDVEALYDSGLNALLATERCIRRSPMYFTLGDNRKYFHAKDLYGVSTKILKGGLCYYFVKDNFYDLATSALQNLGFKEIKFLPSTLAQSMYLFPEKRREGYALLLDVSYMTTSFSVVYGNGIVREETFDWGIGMTITSLMEHFDVEYPLAEEILKGANVSGGTVPKELVWTSENGEYSFPVQEINDVIKYDLDVLCESIENFFQKHYRDKNNFAMPISITGEGVLFLAGAAEHLSKRLDRLTEVLAPDMPYYDKPNFSSRIALLNTALSDKQKRSLFYRIFNHHGGKKK